MEEKLVSLEIAKLAKEKGFDIPCRYSINKEGYDDSIVWSGENEFTLDDIKEAIDNTGEEHYLAPTQSLLQKWLRERHRINVAVIPDTQKTHEYSCTIFNDWTTKGNIIEHRVNVTNLKNEKGKIIYFYYYENALQYGLFEALKLIKL